MPATPGWRLVDAERHRHGLGPLLLGQRPLQDHVPQDDVPPRQRQAGVLRLGIELRAADDAGQEGGLGGGEVAGLGLRPLADLRVVGAGGRLDAVGALTEVDGVEVEAEDLVLGVFLFQLDRDDRFFELAENGPLPPHVGVGVLDVLLGDGGATLGDAPLHDVGERRPGDAAVGERAMSVEVSILGRKNGGLHLLRDRLGRDLAPVLVGGERGELMAVFVQEDDRLGGRHLVGQRDAGEGVVQADHAAKTDREHGQGQPQRPAQEAAPSGALRGRGEPGNARRHPRPRRRACSHGGGLYRRNGKASSGGNSGTPAPSP